MGPVFDSRLMQAPAYPSFCVFVFVVGDSCPSGGERFFVIWVLLRIKPNHGSETGAREPRPGDD